MIDLLAINPDGSWETWYFYGGIPPSEWGNQESGEWQYKRGVLTLDHHGEASFMKGDIKKSISISTVYSKVAVVGDELILSQDDYSVTLQRYYGHLDEYIEQLEFE